MTKKLLEIERKFAYSPSLRPLLLSNRGSPPFPSPPAITLKVFRDKYYDRSSILSKNNLWVRRRLYFPPTTHHWKTFPFNDEMKMKKGTWEAKQSLPGASASFAKTSYEETTDVARIREQVRALLPPMVSRRGVSSGDKARVAGGEEEEEDCFGLEEFASYVTWRREFVAEGKFTVCLDETDFGHAAGEVEVIAEEGEKERVEREMEGFLERYKWLFNVKGEVKGKLGAWLDKYGKGHRK
ncbi:MAG: hypothetical protein LQ351_003405 [Letrouitia transgressa]|nr:MAG: hypothetical protein LQ351_003405 [Letrouitia transgressa]